MNLTEKQKLDFYFLFTRELLSYDGNTQLFADTILQYFESIPTENPMPKADITDGIKKALEIISEINKQIPLDYSYQEDARYNYPERENEVYKRLNSLLSNQLLTKPNNI